MPSAVQAGPPSFSFPRRLFRATLCSESGLVTTDLLARARAHDGDAFRALTEPFRRELQVHCYRMLGSFQDAEDAVQETLVSAWQALGTFEERSSVRTWLFRIATNRCLDALRSAKRRPPMDWSLPDVEPPEPTRRSEIVWLEPYPDSLLQGAVDVPLGPAARYDQTEAISLAFVTALQVLPARQRAVLILRDVLGYHATETASMLDSTLESVNSALKRARATLRRLHESGSGEPPPMPNSAAEQALAEKFVRAYQNADVEALVGLLTEDVLVAMPPVPLEWLGRQLAARFFGRLLQSRKYELVATRANRQLAFGAYLRPRGGGVRRGAGLLVLTLSGERISTVTRFDTDALAWFGLPRSLPA